MQSMDISNLEKMELLDAGSMYNRNTMRTDPTYGSSGLDSRVIQMRISTDNLSERINENFFEPISRYLPIPGINSVEGIMEPLTNVFSGNCFERGQPGRRAADCPSKGKGKGRSGGFGNVECRKEFPKLPKGF